MPEHLLGKVIVKKTFFQTIGVVGLLVFLGMIFVIIPLSNEDHLRARLDPAFEEFKGATVTRYPDKTEREAIQKKAIEEKDRIVQDGSWPLITCRGSMIAQSAGTIYRKDVLSVSCSWGGL